MRLIYLFFLLVSAFSSCRKSSETPYKNVKGTLAGAAGCSGWIIRQDNGAFWEPLNLDAFPVTLKGGQPVIFSFTITNTATVCMTGETIELSSIQDQ
jgi:hypothetical protein